MAQIDSRNQRLEDYTEEAEDIKAKIKDVAENKDVSIVYDTDTPLSLLTKIDNATVKTPSGSISIANNGTVNVANYASAVVNVQPNLQSKSVSITANDTTTIRADSGYDGLSSVEVTTNVSGGGGSYTRPADWLTIPTMSGTTDDVYILNGVVNNGMNMLYFKVSGTGTIDWGDGDTDAFTNASQTTFSHYYNYADVPSSSWTDNNNTRQVLAHISGARGAITYFSTAGILYQYTNEDGVAVSYNTNVSSDIYQISANVSSAEIYCGNSGSGSTSHRQLEIFDWSGTITNTNMSNMFYNCYSLQSIPHLDTSNVTNMNQMFYGCYSLPTIPELNTSNVTDMSGMFYVCYSLSMIPPLDTRNVTNMGSMFQNCYTLQVIPPLDTRNVTNMSSMFSSCRSLQSILPLNTRNVTNMSNMFSSCYSLQVIPELDASNATNMSGMFSNDHSIKKLKLYNVNPTYSSAITISNLSNATMITKDALVDFLNSIAINTSGKTRTIQLGSTIQGYLSNCYVKDSGNYYTTILPTSDTSIQSGKTYYTYDQNTDTYTQVTPDFTTDTFYYELKTAGWNKYVICESTDTGAMLALDFARNVKKYTIT